MRRRVLGDGRLDRSFDSFGVGRGCRRVDGALMRLIVPYLGDYLRHPQDRRVLLPVVGRIRDEIGAYEADVGTVGRLALYQRRGHFCALGEQARRRDEQCCERDREQSVRTHRLRLLLVSELIRYRWWWRHRRWQPEQSPCCRRAARWRRTSPQHQLRAWRQWRRACRLPTSSKQRWPRQRRLPAWWRPRRTSSHPTNRGGTSPQARRGSRQRRVWRRQRALLVPNRYRVAVALWVSSTSHREAFRASWNWAASAWERRRASWHWAASASLRPWRHVLPSRQPPCQRRSCQRRPWQRQLSRSRFVHQPLESGLSL